MRYRSRLFALLVVAAAYYYVLADRDGAPAPAVDGARDAGAGVRVESPAADPGRAVVPGRTLPPTPLVDDTPTVGTSGVGDAPRGDRLVIPVEGIDASALVDTFTQSRSEGRTHEAIDIMAPAGTPVRAVDDGRVAKLFNSVRGGITLYQFDPSERYAYYYAHLQAYAAGVAEQREVRRGEVIGYVGSTGNASPTAPHLHFGIFALGPEREWWKGTALNPYPYLRGQVLK